MQKIEKFIFKIHTILRNSQWQKNNTGKEQQNKSSHFLISGFTTKQQNNVVLTEQQTGQWNRTESPEFNAPNEITLFYAKVPTHS